MTATEVKGAIREILLPRITKEKEAAAMDVIVDFISGNIGDDFPDWASGLVFQTDGTDDGKNCKYPDSSDKVRLWETKVDDNTGHAPPTDPEVTENSYWLEVSASGSGTSQSIFKAKPVKAASIAAIAAAYTVQGNGDLLANANAAFATVDGVTINLNEDILLKDEATIANNGIWRLVVVGTGSVKWRLSRRSDALPTSVDGPMYANSFVYVKSNSNQDQTPNINAGKVFKCMDGVDNLWHENDHEFIHYYGSPPSLTAGDVVKYDMTKVSSSTDEPYAVFVKALPGNYRLFRRSGLLNGILTGQTVGAKIYVQSNGTLSTTVSKFLMGLAVKSNSIQILNLRVALDSELVWANVTLTSAQILNGFTVQPDLIAAPGANKVIIPAIIMVTMDYNGTPYATHTDVELWMGALQVSITVGSLLAVTSDFAYILSVGGITLPINASLRFKVPTGNPTAGNSDLKFKIAYRIVDITA